MECSDAEEATQPIDSQERSLYESLQSQSQTESEQDPPYWGRLYPLDFGLPACDLNKEKVTIGKGCGVDIKINQAQLPDEIFRRFSRVHFEIGVITTQAVGALVSKTYIRDKSSNGTFVNGRLLKNSKFLASNDIIGFPSLDSYYEAYVYMESPAPLTRSIPTLVRNKYQVSRQLGVGSFGEVSLVFNKENCRPYAMKTIVKHGNVAFDPKLDSMRKKLLKELEILQRVNVGRPNFNVIQLVDVVECQKESFLILEYMKGKDLAQRIRDHKLDEKLCKIYFYQIMKGVEYLHSCGIIHRDLKPANILLASSKMLTLLKLTDFGLSKILSPSSEMNTECGTMMFVAPEVLSGGGVSRYTSKVDVWSAGVTLYLCLSGKGPFSASESESLEDQIQEARYSMPLELWGNISLSARKLVNRLLVRNPNDRLSVEDTFKETWLQDEEMLRSVNEIYLPHYKASQEDLLSSNSSSMNSIDEHLNEVFGQTCQLSYDSSVSVSPPNKRLKI